MSAELTDFSISDTVAPVGGFAPTSRELQALGVIGLDMGQANRAILMNRIGAVLGNVVAGDLGRRHLAHVDAHDVLPLRGVRTSSTKPGALRETPV